MKELIIVKDFVNDTLQGWSAKNPDLIHLIDFSGNKLLFIHRLIPTPDAATNQTGSPLSGPNNANIGRSGRENTIAVDSTVENEKTEESNGDIKVGLEVQPNTQIMDPVFYWPTTAISTLILTFLVSISICRPFTPDCSSMPLLSWVQLFFRVPYV